MLCKGIVDKVIDPYSARIRIPIYHQIAGSPFATRSEDLPIAPICSLPGISMALTVGDIVFVDFELDQREHPVIVGCLSRNNSNSSSNIKAQSITVDVSCDLPKETNVNNSNLETIIERSVESNSDIEFIFDDEED